MLDEQILQLFITRNESAIHETNIKYGSYCNTISYNILNNKEDAEECVNETWYRTWNAIPPAFPKYLKLFLAKITRNISINKLKSNHANKRCPPTIAVILDELQESIPNEFDLEDVILAKELALIMNRFVHTLPKQNCNLFVRRYFFNDSIETISKMYGISKSNVILKLSRIRTKLRVYLEQEGYTI